MPSSGEPSENFGVYKTRCCDAEIVIGVGVLFPDCPNHKDGDTEWIQIPDAEASTTVHEPKVKRETA
jgi:hypothetical protein